MEYEEMCRPHFVAAYIRQRSLNKVFRTNSLETLFENDFLNSIYQQSRDRAAKGRIQNIVTIFKMQVAHFTMYTILISINYINIFLFIMYFIFFKYMLNPEFTPDTFFFLSRRSSFFGSTYDSTIDMLIMKQRFNVDNIVMI